MKEAQRWLEVLRQMLIMVLLLQLELQDKEIKQCFKILV